MVRKFEFLNPGLSGLYKYQLKRRAILLTDKNQRQKVQAIIRQMSVTKKPFTSLTSKPPTQQAIVHPGPAHAGGFDSATLTSLTAKNASGVPPSKWSINIQDIVKRTQKNLDRGSSAALKTAGSDRREGSGSGDMDLNYLNKQTKLGFGSSSSKEKNSLLYQDLKKKLSYESAQGQNNRGGGVALTNTTGNVSAGLHRKDNLLGGLASANAPKTVRQASVSNNSASGAHLGGGIKQSLYLANQKSAASLGAPSSKLVSDRLAIQKLKRRGGGGAMPTDQCNMTAPLYEYNNTAAPGGGSNQRQNSNDVSGATSGSLQGTQGGDGIYFQENGLAVYSAPGGMTLEERSQAHQKTLMAAGRLNLLGQVEEPDEESHVIGLRPDLRRHNSNSYQGGAPMTGKLNLTIHDQQLQQEAFENDSQAIVEAGDTEEQTQRNNQRSLNRTGASIDNSLEQIDHHPGYLGANNFIQTEQQNFNDVRATGTTTSGLLKLNQLRPSNSTGQTNIGTLTDTQINRQTKELKGRLHGQGGHNTTKNGGTSGNNNVEHRQKIFEEEIIKRIKEIQRYVKSLHLQIKKTQASSEKLKEEIDGDKDILLSLQQSQETINKKYASDKIKQVTSSEVDTSIKEAERRFSDKLSKRVQEAVDSTLKQVKDEIVPEVRLKMFDSLAEESQRLKHDVEYQLSALKRELADNQKKDRQKNSEFLSQEVAAVRNELQTDQSTQKLNILSQVEAQIGKALKEQRQQENVRSEVHSLRADFEHQLKATESKLKVDWRQEMQTESQRVIEGLEGSIDELAQRTQDTLKTRLQSLSASFVTPEYLSDKLTSLKHEVIKAAQSDLKKCTDSLRVDIVTPDLMQSELLKVKRDVTKQIKTGLEETKFDTIQMVQSDMVEVTTQQKETRLRVSELSARLDELRSQQEESLQRLANRDKEQSSLKITSGQLTEQQASYERRLDDLAGEIHQIKLKETMSPQKSTPIKQETLDSQRSTPQTIALEELESLRRELSDVSNHCNRAESSVEAVQSEVGLLKSSQERQVKGLASKLEDVHKQLIDTQFEAGQNKQFLEDQLVDVTRNLEGLHTRVQESEQASEAICEALKQELNKHSEKAERQFTNLLNGVSLLEEWQSRVKDETAAATLQTAQTSEASARQEERIGALVQDQLDEMSYKLGDLSEAQRALAPQMSQLQTQVQEVQQEAEQLQQMLLDKIYACEQDAKSLELTVEQTATQIEKTVTQVEQTATQVKKTVTQVEQTATQVKTTANRVEQTASQVEAVQSKVKQQDSVSQDLAVQIASFEERLGLRASNESLTQLKRELTNEIASLQTQLKESAQKQTIIIEQPQARKWQQSQTKTIGVKETFATPSESRKESLLGQAPPLSNKEATDLMTPQKNATSDASAPPLTEGEIQKSATSPRIEETGTDEQADKLGELAEQKSLVSKSCMPKPTEYSASVGQTRRDFAEPRASEEQSELEIKSPVQFELLPESDVKVNETTSSQADRALARPPDFFESEENLMLQERLAFDQDLTNLNAKIISPSDGVQVPSADFYKRQRDFKSNQVLKRNEMAIRVQVDQAIESEKVDSPKPLGEEFEYGGVNDGDDGGDVSAGEVSGGDVSGGSQSDQETQEVVSQVMEPSDEGQDQTAVEAAATSIDGSHEDRSPDGRSVEGRSQESRSPEGSRLQLPCDTNSLDDEPPAEGASSAIEEIQKSSSGLLIQQPKKGVSTIEHLDVGGCGESQDSDQLEQAGESQLLFRTQKMAGLAMLSQKATQQALEGLDEADIELDSELQDKSQLHSDTDGDEQSDNPYENATTPAAGESDIDEIPASAAILGMRLGDHNRNPSESKSSMMGLSALGLESHRESLEEGQQMAALLPNDEQDPNEVSEQDSETELPERVIIDQIQLGIAPEISTPADEEETQDEQVARVLSALIGAEVEQALAIMRELNHPNAMV